ncbi:MAG TPA: glycosyltransferase family 4 protein [Ktedonobacteraceae bacterium]|nr:glycosyltransferase family 4 protein [Ktedonobacteraceae bacterium]
MRILMLAQFYPPTIGGEERHVADLSADLVARGHDVSVATLWHKGPPRYEVSRGVQIHRIRGSMQRLEAVFRYGDRQFSPPFTDPEAMLALKQIIEKERPDIIHAHNWIVHSVTPLKAWSKAKLVMTLHDYSLVCVQKRLMNNGVARCSGPGFTKCLSCARNFYGPKGIAISLANRAWGVLERQAVDMFLPVSNSVADETHLKKHAVPFQIVPNFIPDEPESLTEDTETLLTKLPKQDFLLYVGDVMPDKGIDVLLEAHAKLDRKIPLVLIGRPIDGYLEHFPPNVIYMGRWPHNAVMQAWKLSTMALVPSTCPDACPSVAMEAMKMGVPIVASRIGGLTDIVEDGVTGLLVTPDDPQALQAGIQHVLNDEELRNRMRIGAMKRVEEFQAKSVVPRIEQVYREVLMSCR